MLTQSRSRADRTSSARRPSVNLGRTQVAATGLLLCLSLVLTSCAQLNADQPAGISLVAARRGFSTRLLVQKKTPDPVPAPPPQLFQLVHYPAPLGEFPAYISQPPSRGKKYPAIVWITGGFSNSIDDTPWAPATPDNDQSASAFWKSGVITMYPSLRGGNNNAGYIETFYGEVNDVVAAAQYLARQKYVDPRRIYLGGHSTGGTLALLTAEYDGRFRDVFAFGPVASAGHYGADSLTFDYHNPTELKLRAPILWLNDIAEQTFVFEGTESPGNIDSLHTLEAANHNPRVHFLPVPGVNHFSSLAVVTPVLAAKILHDTGPVTAINITPADLSPNP